MLLYSMNRDTQCFGYFFMRHLLLTAHFEHFPLTGCQLFQCTKVGEWCMIGGQVGIAGHAKIGDKVGLGAQSGVPGDIKSGSQLIGTPPMELKQYFKSSIAQRSLPDMQKELRNLRKEVEELKQLLNK